MQRETVKTPEQTSPPENQPGVLEVGIQYLRPKDADKFNALATDEERMAEQKRLEPKAIAKAVLHPEVLAARVIQNQEGDALNINACTDELAQLIAEAESGDMSRPAAMLVAQAHTLDHLFSKLALRSLNNATVGHLDAADRYMRLALRAQSQAVKTIEALTEMKNPRPIAFIKQANVANGLQQVNNGVAGTTPRTEKTLNQSNELLEIIDGERLDFGAQKAPLGIDSELASMGEIHGATNQRREGGKRT